MVFLTPSFAVRTSTFFAAPNTESFPIPFLPITFLPSRVLSLPSSMRLFLPIRRYLSAMSPYDMPSPSSLTTMAESSVIGPSGSVISTLLASASQEFATISEMTGGSLPCSFMPRSSMTGSSILITSGLCGSVSGLPAPSLFVFTTAASEISGPAIRLAPAAGSRGQGRHPCRPPPPRRRPKTSRPAPPAPPIDMRWASSWTGPAKGLRPPPGPAPRRSAPCSTGSGPAPWPPSGSARQSPARPCPPPQRPLWT